MPPDSTDIAENSVTKDTVNSDTWKNAWLTTPGPRTFNEHASLFLKGVGMGSADIVPGVSGGTIAFITGIYEMLLTAISSINVKLILKVLISKEHCQYFICASCLHLFQELHSPLSAQHT